jgi:hypothetical protein
LADWAYVVDAAGWIGHGDILGPLVCF